MLIGELLEGRSANRGQRSPCEVGHGLTTSTEAAPGLRARSLEASLQRSPRKRSDHGWPGRQPRGAAGRRRRIGLAPTDQADHTSTLRSVSLSVSIPKAEVSLLLKVDFT